MSSTVNNSDLVKIDSSDDEDTNEDPTTVKIAEDGDDGLVEEGNQASASTEVSSDEDEVDDDGGDHAGVTEDEYDLDADDRFIPASNKRIFIKIVRDNDRISSDLVSRYECARMLSVRAAQMEKSDHTFSPDGCQRFGLDASDVIMRALAEILDRRYPMKIMRLVHVEKMNDNGDELHYKEEWDPNEMIYHPDAYKAFMPILGT
jgi:hypothetical protein